MTIKNVAGVLLHTALLVRAGFEQMAAQLESFSNVSAGADSQLLRGAGFNLYVRARYISKIRNSGCWCYFDDDHHLAKGRPVNDVDRLCQKLHHGYSCAIMDYGEDSCAEPWNVEYQQPSSSRDYRQACSVNNINNECAVAACIIENNFVAEF